MMSSVRAYHEVLVEGKVSRNQQRILHWMTEIDKPTTSGELLGNRVANLNLWRARMTELANKGAICEVDRRKCQWSGRQAIVWTLAPRPWKPRRSRGDYYKELEQLMDQALLALERSKDAETRSIGATLRLTRYRLMSS